MCTRRGTDDSRSAVPVTYFHIIIIIIIITIRMFGVA